MAKVKYNVKGVDTDGEFKPVKPGMYRAKIEEINDWSGQYGPGMEVVLSVTSDSKGKKKDVEGIGSKLWTYIYFDHEPSAFRLAEFIKALGLKESGTLDTDKLVGKEVQVRVKPDRNEDNEYRPRVGKLLALADDAGEEPDEPEEGEEDEDDEDDDGVDLDELDRAGLKKFIKENELDVSVKKSMSDDDIRAAITEATSEEEPEEPEEEPEEPEEEPEEDDEDDDGVDLDELDRSALKKFIKDNELDVKVTKGMSDDDIRAAIAEAAESDDDEEEPDDEEEDGEKDEAPDYNSWSQTKLKTELKERGLKLSGDFTKRKAVNALKKDDASDDEPF